MLKVVLSLLLIAAITGSATDRYVTFTAKEGEIKKIQLTSEDAGQLVMQSLDNASAWIFRDGQQFTFREGQIVQGPCELWLRGDRPTTLGMGTFRVLRNTQPPDKTMVIPQGGSASIVLQCSSNLVDWVTATNGNYTNVPSMKFFRIYSERIP